MISSRELFEAIIDIQIKNELRDWLIAQVPNLLHFYGIECEKVELNAQSLKFLSTCYLPFYPTKTWASKHNFTVKDYPHRIKLKKNDGDNKIVIFVKGRRKLIIDGCHRAIAMYQGGKSLKGIIIMLKTKEASRIAPKDF